MRGQKKDLAFDAMLTLVAYLIFAISLLAANIVKYPNIKLGFNILVVLSGIFMYYNLHNFNKGLK
jgi:hypothetical protein